MAVPNSSGDTAVSATSVAATLGELLAQARVARGLTLEQISHETNIPQRHLEALEQDNFGAVPDAFYRRAEIRTFARVVHLDEAVALASLERTLHPQPAVREVLLVHEVAEPAAQDPPQRSSTAVLLGVGALIATAMLLSSTRARTPSVLEDGSRPIATVSQGALKSVVQTTPVEANVMAAQTPAAKTVVPSRPQPQPRNLNGKSAVPPSTATTGTGPVRTADVRPATSVQPAGPAGQVAAAKQISPATQVTPARQALPTQQATQLSVATEPAGAQVTVDGIGWGTAPIAIANIPAGTKRIRVSKPGFASEEREVSLVDGRRQRLAIRLRPKL